MKNKKILFFILIIIVIFVSDRYFGWSGYITSGKGLSYLDSKIEENFFLAGSIYLLLTIIGTCLLAIPGVTFAIISGALFGPVTGTFLCSIGATIGAILAFIAGRYFLKESIKPIVMKNNLIKKWLFEEDKKSEIFILMITRLVPIFPFNLQNFAYGITDISLSTYSFFTFIFIIPGTAMYTIGTAGILDSSNRGLLIISAVLIGVLVFGVGFYLKGRFIKPSETVFFPGCNFYALYPKTTKEIENYFKERNIDIYYKCCRTKNIFNVFQKSGIKKVITACPNCYYYLQNDIGIEVTNIYDEIDDIESIDISGEVYLPCPDRGKELILKSVKTHIKDLKNSSYKKCCGYGEFLKKKKEKFKREFAENMSAHNAQNPLYTYCATCSYSCAKGGIESEHLLCCLFDTKEKATLKGYGYRWIKIKLS